MNEPEDKKITIRRYLLWTGQALSQLLSTTLLLPRLLPPELQGSESASGVTYFGAK
jgi:hypothetical protein